MLAFVELHFYPMSTKEKPEVIASGFSFGHLYSTSASDLVDEQKAPSEARHLTAMFALRANLHN